MRTINLVGICSMALMLAAAAFSAGCEVKSSDGDGGAGGEGTTGTTTSSGQGGNASGEGGGGEGGSASGEGGSAACLRCADSFDPDLEGELCEDSVDAYDALAACLCQECGAAEGDACYAACNADGEQDEACTTCGQDAIAEGACETELAACLADQGT